MPVVLRLVLQDILQKIAQFADIADLVPRLGIERAPTLLIIKQGAITAKTAGLMNPKEFCAFYQQSMRTA